VEDEQVVDGCLGVADRLGEGLRRLDGEARAIEAVVEGHVACREGARGGVRQHLADGEILEEVSRTRFAFAH
jgi:hypothetical protein